ncbi:zinc finger MYM-type protein 2 [Aplochiton taeniatus]
MDGESESRPALEEEEGVEPMDATPSSEQTAPLEGAEEAVAVATEAFPQAPEDNDDDVVLVGEGATPAPSDTPAALAPTDCTEPAATATAATGTTPTTPSKSPSPPAISLAAPKTPTEPIVIDDEEESELKDSSPDAVVLSSTEPDSEIKIASVTTLGQTDISGAVADAPLAVKEPPVDMNLLITSVTSLQGEGQADGPENGLQISSAFSLNPEACKATFNPGRVALASQPTQNGEAGTHSRTDSWISQSASFPRNQKQTGADSLSPTASLPKPPGQSSSGSQQQQPPRTVKVTCANCKKPLKKGQTAYQRKGSTHLFCSTTCLSAFSHKPAPKKSCTMCKKDITTMKGTIVAQVDSSESFQEFCSTGCLGAYENKQNPPKSGLKTKCTVCGKLTEIRHEVSFKNVTHKICSDSCFNRYRMANGLIMNCCEQCGDYLPSRASANHFLLVDGQQKRFCCQNCVRDFKQANSKLTSCSSCKTLIKTGEVLHSIGPSGTMESYCSMGCMNKSKIPTATILSSEPTCHFCKKNSLPQYQATLPEGTVLNFCGSQCVTKFQNATIQTATNGQPPLSTSNNSVQLKCNYCRGGFSMKPETLEWEDKMYQFCSKACCEDYKKLHCIVTFCENCQEEKTLYETVKFSGVKRPFCSEGCKLLFKQDFARRLGLKCVTCNHCSQLCKRGVTRQLGSINRDFCSETCAKKFHDWYYKAARCDCCKVQGNLTESVQWRAEMKRFCDQQCLLRFYLQQNEPIMVTQKGPENTSLGFGTQAAKLGMLNQGAVAFAAGGVKDVKNKAVLCKPLTLTKATYCKPHTQSKLLQTDMDDGVKREYIPVPIPVPVFIPVPMSMYSQLTPTPLTLPLPIPVPVFLPTTLQGAEEIVRAVRELRAKVPADPLEGDLLSMAEAIAEDQKPATASEPVPVLEGLDVKVGLSLPSVLAKEEEEEEEVPRPHPRRQGHKRRAVEAGDSDPSSSSSPTSRDGAEGRSLPLRARYGVNAWKRWALSSSDQSDQTKGKDGPKPVVPSRSRTNLLALSSGELCLSLARFVQEVRRPGGERYSPDSVFYLCLGIQQHLHAKGRKDDLFSDSCYQQFGVELHKVLKDWQPNVLPDGSLWGRVQEQSLWTSHLLGEQSPAALLRSLVYLNTKYFGLRTVEQHLGLTFADVYGPDVTDPLTKETHVCGPSPPPQEHPCPRKRKRPAEDGDPDYEPDDGSGGSTRRPFRKHEWRLYELYRAKCPGPLSQRADVFYAQPEASSGPDSPLWFSSTSLERGVLESLLTRVLLVTDIYREGQPQQQQEEEEEAEEEVEAEEVEAAEAAEAEADEAEADEAEAEEVATEEQQKGEDEGE